MPARPKVPFTLHAALSLRANTDIVHATTASLSPDGALVAVLTGVYQKHAVELHEVATGAVLATFPAPPDANLVYVVWSPDGQRWAAGGNTWADQKQRGVVLLGDRNAATTPRVIHTSVYGTYSINDLQIPASVLSFSPDGTRLVMRVSGYEQRNGLFHIDVASGDVREQWLDPEELDIIAQSVGPDGTVYTLHHEASPVGGLAWYKPGSDALEGRHPWIFGCVIVPTANGLWVLGSRSTWAFRLANLTPAPSPSAEPERRARIEMLRNRARAKWDQNWLEYQRKREDSGQRAQPGFAPRRGAWSSRETVDDTPGARSFETEIFWETAMAAALGEDLLVSDAVSLWHWHFDGSALRRPMLLDDPQRSTRAQARLLALSVAGDTVIVLWRRDNSGAKCVLSRFTLDRKQLPG